MVLFYKAKDLEPELRWFANAFRVRPTIIAQANAECNPLKTKNAAGNGGVLWDVGSLDGGAERGKPEFGELEALLAEGDTDNGDAPEQTREEEADAEPEPAPRSLAARASS